jgi:hypothetical protein
MEVSLDLLNKHSGFHFNSYSSRSKTSDIESSTSGKNKITTYVTVQKYSLLRSSPCGSWSNHSHSTHTHKRDATARTKAYADALYQQTNT